MLYQTSSAQLLLMLQRCLAGTPSIEQMRRPDPAALSPS